MEINFNSVRKQALQAYEKLAYRLNEGVITNDEQYAQPNDATHGMVNLKGYVLVDANDIRDTMSDLRMMLCAIASTYEPGDDDFKDVYSEVYPEGSGKRMTSFNVEVEE